MRKTFASLAVLLAFFVSACTTTSGVYRPSGGGEIVLGTVQTRFKAAFKNNADHIIDKAVYIALLESARKDYMDPIDVCDITWVSDGDSPSQQYFATGTVVLSGQKTNFFSGPDFWSPLR
jgi:hypothetical protein